MVHCQAVAVGEAGVADGDIDGLRGLFIVGPGDVQQHHILFFGRNGVGPLRALGDGQIAGHIFTAGGCGFHLGKDTRGDVGGTAAAAAKALHDGAAKKLPQQEAERGDDDQKHYHQQDDFPCGGGFPLLRRARRHMTTRHVITTLPYSQDGQHYKRCARKIQQKITKICEMVNFSL